MSAADRLPGWRAPLAVVAHPDDESFGLGALLSTFAGQGASPSLLCFTHGEASTLHGVDGDLHQIRARELQQAARTLALTGVELLDEPDGTLADRPVEKLSAAVQRAIQRHTSDGLLVFDTTGVTGHPDHVAATRAALVAAARTGLPVLAWTLPEPVAHVLNAEFGAGFLGRPAGEIDLRVTVNRATQRAAVLAHPSQAVPGSVLWRRLDLLADREHLTWLAPPPAGAATPRPELAAT